MGDSRRFHLFAQVAKRNLKTSLKIVDVAGGQGHLRLALKEMGFNNVETWDKRHNKIPGKQRYQYFTHNVKENYEAVVAMHPDEATDHAIIYAGKHKIPAIVCPCCVKPDAEPFWDNHNSANWMKHLISLAHKYGLKVQQTFLPMRGKNEVLILKP